MKQYTRSELLYKIDVILDNIVDDERSIKILIEKFNTWFALEWTSGTISANDFSYAREYGINNIKILHTIRS